MNDFPPLYVLRHGETEWNRAGRLQGAMDSPLTDTGRAQAAKQRDILLRLDLKGMDWRTSPQGRARVTAEIANGAPLPETCLDARLREIEMGDWTGRARSEIAASNPVLFETDDLSWYDHAPGGEGLAKLAARVEAFLNDCTRPTVVITHGITSRVLRCLATGQPWEALDLVGGGQGVVYQVINGQQIQLT